MGKSNRTSARQNRTFQKHGATSLVILMICTAIACVWYYSHEPTPVVEKTLRFVSIVHRHGERSPLHSYPLDPYNGESYWPEGLGALLKVGKVNMYGLGKFLRHRYNSFLSEIYKPKEIFVSTLNTDRIIISGQLVLAGLYPPVGIQIWNTDLPWQPIPLHPVPTSCDDMFHASKRCELLSIEEKQRAIVIQNEVDKHQEFLAFLSNNTGLDVKTASHVNHIFDNLLVVRQQALDLPRWAQDIYPEKIKSIAEMEFMEFFKTPTTIKLQSGVFINEIVSNMNRKIDATKNFEHLLHLYPVSDRVIVRLWQGLNISQEITNKPNYGAALFIELHEINNKYRVKILHKEGTLDDKLRTLRIRGCEDSHNLAEDEMCDLEVFSSALESMIITDFDEACKNT